MKKLKIFLGGTCSNSTWREELLNKFDLVQLRNEYNTLLKEKNPIVKEWTKERQIIEDYHRETDDICLYVITPEMKGFYSFVEVVDDSNKRPEKTILCVLEKANGKTYEEHIKKCVIKTMQLVKDNGVKVFDNLNDLSNYLNEYNK